MSEHFCENCYYENFLPITYPCSMCIRGYKRTDKWAPKIGKQTEPKYDAEEVAKDINRRVDMLQKAKVVGYATDSVSGEILGMTLDTDCSWK